MPAGYHAITPYFTVADADRLIAFMTDAFDGDVLIEDRSDNGRVRHARVCIGDSIVMLNEAGDDYAANESQMHLFVEDVDATFTRALQQGWLGHPRENAVKCVSLVRSCRAGRCARSTVRRAGPSGGSAAVAHRLRCAGRDGRSDCPSS